jgi:hypothetical protein
VLNQCSNEILLSLVQSSAWLTSSAPLILITFSIVVVDVVVVPPIPLGGTVLTVEVLALGRRDTTKFKENLSDISTCSA